jgi:Flp pilus assembly protein TadG
MKPRGQMLIVVAILLMVVLMILAVAVDGGRLLAERARLRRAAQAAADAGIGLVAEAMVTQAAPRQTQAAALPTCAPAGPCTPTPALNDVPGWLTDEDRAALVAPPMQTQVAAEAIQYAQYNGFPQTEVSYPQAYDSGAPVVRIQVTLRRRATILLAGLLGQEWVDLVESGLSQVPQR